MSLGWVILAILALLSINNKMGYIEEWLSKIPTKLITRTIAWAGALIYMVGLVILSDDSVMCVSLIAFCISWPFFVHHEEQKQKAKELAAKSQAR